MADSNGFKIEKSVPLPNIWPFGEMEVGDSFSLGSDFDLVKRCRTAAGNQTGRAGKKFSVRRTDDGYRCWRVA